MKHIEQLKLEEFSYSPSRSWKASHWRKTMIFFRKSLIPEVPLNVQHIAGSTQEVRHMIFA